MTVNQVAVRLADFIVAHVDNWWMFLICIDILFLFFGCVMDDVAAMMILSPLMATALDRFQIDYIHFGVVMTLLIEYGFLTPPFGVNLFVAMGLTRKPLMQVAKGVAPFLVILLACVVLATFIPQLSLFLPTKVLK